MRIRLPGLAAILAAGFLLGGARSAHAATDTLSGDCPQEAHSSVGDLSHAIAVIGASNECVGAIANVDLSTVKNLSRETGCRGDGPCTIRKVIEEMAKEAGLPADLLFAVAWTETNWHQYDKNGKPIVSKSNDIGLFQINKSWKGSFDIDQVAGDMLYNARAASKILKWSYGVAKKKGLKGDKLMQSSYAIYNGGPAAWDRPWDPASPWAEHDRNFKKYEQHKPWIAATKDC